MARMREWYQRKSMEERDRPAISHAHHPDYAKPLDVVWLCTAHHADVHHRAAA